MVLIILMAPINQIKKHKKSAVTAVCGNGSQPLNYLFPITNYLKPKHRAEFYISDSS